MNNRETASSYAILTLGTGVIVLALFCSSEGRALPTRYAKGFISESTDEHCKYLKPLPVKVKVDHKQITNSIVSSVVDADGNILNHSFKNILAKAVLRIGKQAACAGILSLSNKFFNNLKSLVFSKEVKYPAMTIFTMTSSYYLIPFLLNFLV